MPAREFTGSYPPPATTIPSLRSRNGTGCSTFDPIPRFRTCRARALLPYGGISSAPTKPACTDACVRRIDEAQSIAAEIRRLGPVFNDDVRRATYALYVPLQERAPKDGVQVHKDLAYGEDPRHRLDVFVADQRPEGTAAVVAFFHGGGYVSGERDPVPGLIYDNVPTFFARHGLIGVNATYRLAPGHKWPSGGEDVGKVVAWLVRNIGRYGGDPDRIFLVGHSAGATHVATWIFMEKIHGSVGPRIAGAALISGVYAA